jgi:hypothetical protein
VEGEGRGAPGPVPGGVHSGGGLAAGSGTASTEAAAVRWREQGCAHGEVRLMGRGW